MRKLEISNPEDVEYLAELLHASGREAVEKRLIYRDDIPVKPFCEWKDLPENAKEGRRSMARFFLQDGRPWYIHVDEVRPS